MNSKSIRRNITAASPVIRPKDNSWMTGIPKVRAKGTSTKPDLAPRKSWDGRREKAPRKTIPVFMVIAAVGVLAGLIGVAIIARRGVTTTPSPVTQIVADPDSAPVAAVQLPIGEEAAFGIVRDALAARDTADIRRSICTGRTSPEKVLEFMQALPAREGEVDQMIWLSSIEADGTTMEGVKIIFTKDGVASNRLALLTQDETGGWLMDFAAFARLCEPPWKEILGSHEGPSTVRVVLAPESYYNGAFQDDTVWRCLVLASPDLDHLLYGYCKVGSPQHLAMGHLLEDGDGAVRAVITIQRREGGDGRQFEITGVIARDWHVGDAATPAKL